MAQKSKKKEDDAKKEVVANSCLGKRPIGPSGDYPEEVMANCETFVTSADSIL